MSLFVINPLHIRNGKHLEFQVAWNKAIQGRPLEAIQLLVNSLANGKGATQKEIARLLTDGIEGLSVQSALSFVKKLVSVKILLPKEKRKAFAEKILQTYLKKVCPLHCRLREGKRVSKDEWPIFIFASKVYFSDEFATHMLLLALRKGYPFRAFADSGQTIRIEIERNGMVRSFHSGFRDVTEFDFRSQTITEDKWTTNYLCALAGIPVPPHIKCLDMEHGKVFANREGFPLVLKPTFGHDGEDVYPHIRSLEDLKKTLRKVLPKYKNEGGLSLEKYVPGNRYRIVLLGSKLVGAVACYAPKITGDGQHTIAELIEQKNKAWSQKGKMDESRSSVIINQALKDWIGSQNLKLRSVLPKGNSITLQGVINSTRGGVVELLPPSAIHPKVIELTRKTLRLVGLHFGGIDYIAPNVSEPPEECGGIVLEIQAHPGGTHCEKGVWKTFMLDPYSEFLEKVCDYAFEYDMNRPPAILDVSQDQTLP